MRGQDAQNAARVGTVSVEERIPIHHPLRAVGGVPIRVGRHSNAFVAEMAIDGCA